MKARVNVIECRHRDVIAKVSSQPQHRGPKNWPRPRDYRPRPHDSRGLGLVQLGVVVFEVLLNCFVMVTLNIWYFLFSV